MWQEAKKQEKILRGIMVDYKRRAERRKGYYDKCKRDPAEFLQLWGRQSKIHIDPSVAAAADNPSIMTKWRGDDNTLIDRFDARSHLDFLVEYNDPSGEEPPEALDNEERMLNYERYRTLVQNEAVGISENQCLKQIDLDEKFGGLDKPSTHEKKSKEPKAQIGFVYEDGNIVSSKNQYVNPKAVKSPSPTFSDDDTDEDLDLALDINKLTSEHKIIINKCATEYGMQYGDYVRMLILDNEEKETLIRNKLLEAEKAQYSGRRSRRERRIAKDKRLKERGSLSPLSYIVKDEPTKEKTNENYGDYFEGDSKSTSRRSNSRSRSRSRHRARSGRSSRSRTRSSSPSNAKNKVLFITSFGAEDQDDQNESNNHFLNNLNKNKKNSMANTLVFNAKLLKTKISSMSPQSRSPSRSPVKEVKTEKAEASVIFKNSNRSNFNKTKQAAHDSDTSQSSNSSDEEEALKKYLKRKENRKQNTNADDKTTATNANLLSSKNGNSKTNELNSNNNTNNNNKNTERSSLSSKNNNLNKEETNSQSKFRNAEEFKIYQDKLKKKMQKQINKQLKQDQKVEREKRRKEYDERREREAKLSYLTEKMRERHKKERRRNREANGIYTSSSDESSRSRSRSRSRSPNSSRRRSRSRSRSPKNSRSRNSHRKHSRSTSRERMRSSTNKSRSRSKSPNRRDSSSSSSSSSDNEKLKSSVVILKPTRKRSSSSSSRSSSSSPKPKKRAPSSTSSSSSSSSSSKSRSKRSRQQTNYRNSKRSSRSSS